VICGRIACVTELAHQLDCAMGNQTDSFMDNLEESVFDMEDIDVEVSNLFLSTNSTLKAMMDSQLDHNTIAYPIYYDNVYIVLLLRLKWIVLNGFDF